MIVPREATVAASITGSGNSTIMTSSLMTASPSDNSPELTAPLVVCTNGTDTNNSSILLSGTTSSIVSASSPGKMGYSRDLDAFLYIIVVLSFYAISIALLMINYIRREREETILDHDYTEYVNRSWFDRPDVQNRLAMKRERQWIQKVLQSERFQSSKEDLEQGRVYRETDL